MNSVRLVVVPRFRVTYSFSSHCFIDPGKCGTYEVSPEKISIPRLAQST